MGDCSMTSMVPVWFPHRRRVEGFWLATEVWLSWWGGAACVENLGAADASEAPRCCCQLHPRHRPGHGRQRAEHGRGGVGRICAGGRKPEGGKRIGKNIFGGVFIFFSWYLFLWF